MAYGLFWVTISCFVAFMALDGRRRLAQPGTLLRVTVATRQVVTGVVALGHVGSCLALAVVHFREGAVASAAMWICFAAVEVVRVVVTTWPRLVEAWRDSQCPDRRDRLINRLRSGARRLAAGQVVPSPA